MRGREMERWGRVLAAAGLSTLLVAAVMVVQASGSGSQATKSASVASQLKKLKKRIAALEAKPDQVGQVPTIPATLPPSGAAGGDLTGTYPNPQLGPDVVGAAEVGANALGGAEILEDTLGQVPSATTAGNGFKGFALITAAGDVSIAAPHPNIGDANVFRASEGKYCFDGLPFFPSHIQVTGDPVSGGNAAQDNFFSASVLGLSSDCAGTEDALVESRDDDPAAAAGLQDAAFYVAFF